ncbi:hypothetical protein KKD81_02005 [Patescibacteria group bacterium]|nr:hypothetical protein [Patescibacteria group bacterium]MBU2159069.1 hypothetical protein [Patescibacteria group bacterium]MBU2220691.1 hypothetical protein [Patescibacteria group bacterium]
MSGETIYDPSKEKAPSHYHGDVVRALFVAAAVLIFLTQFIGTSLPFSTGGIMFLIVCLVISAGITNPAQQWIHWVNVFISIIGFILFGGIALTRINSSIELLSQNTLVALLTLVFISTLYLGTRTLRGLMVSHVERGY